VDVALKAIGKKLSALRLQLKDVEDAIQQEQDRGIRINAQIQGFEELRDELENERPPVSQGAGDGPPINESDNGDRLGPTDAVLVLLKDRPGLTAGEMADALEHRVESTAKNVKHNIRTTAFNLVKKGMVTRDEDGRHYIAE